MYDRFIAYIQPFCAQYPSTPVNGEYYDLPDKVVFNTYSKPLAAKGRIEVNSTTPDAPADFEWRYELTINDKADKRFVHLIIREDDKSVVETYGKTILPVSPERGEEIFDLLAELMAQPEPKPPRTRRPNKPKE